MLAANREPAAQAQRNDRLDPRFIAPPGVARSLLREALVSLATFLGQQRPALVAVAVAATVAGGYALSRTTRGPQASPVSASAPAADAPSSPSLTSAEASAARAPQAAPRAAAGGDAAADPDRVAALRRGLASEDEATRIAAVEAAVSATAIETLGDLERFELARDPQAAPTVIHAVALLGASAEGTKRDDAAGTLARWLREEQRRDGPDVPGNVSNIVEALGDVGGRQAVDALGAALDRAELALHVQTLAVMKLGELGDPRARPPVERFAKRVAALPPAEGIDEELRVEAMEAARATLSRI
ncbi:MAG TPA: hypothetical protein VLT33_44285 [Labilithrix sp.]|nr:hypothetical protein [Labilithrix sp.]